ncbi:MAG: flagellar brake protein [Lachnospiraceae bacterium]|nr:flagellar brake protein [Lachnospiraceae bacterium]MBO5145792.1 flagellar brake protein [Lachnospiraceae bacterium]
MIEKLISPGDKLEMKSIVKVVLPDGTEGVKTYKTSVFDVLDDGRLEIVMPTEQAKLVLLPVDGEYDVCFFSHSGMYRADVRIVDRQKINGTYVLGAEIISSLRKFQKKEYYRFNCVLEMTVRELTQQEADTLEKGSVNLTARTDMIRGVIVDISGGGTRFVTRQRFHEGSHVLMRFSLPAANREKPFLLAAKVVLSKEIENRPQEYENRAKFEFMDNAVREEIIKYIFDAERKNRKMVKVVESYDN